MLFQFKHLHLSDVLSLFFRIMHIFLILGSTDLLLDVYNFKIYAPNSGQNEKSNEFLMAYCKKPKDFEASSTYWDRLFPFFKE